MKKKLIALVTALTLCAVVVVGGALAYFSQQTGDVYNVFTYDPDGSGFNPDPDIQEPNWPGEPDITPGTATPKDPRVVLTNPDLAGKDNEFVVAMIIRGGSSLSGVLSKNETDKYTEVIDMTKLFNMLDKSEHTYTKRIYGEVANPAFDDTKAEDPDTNPRYIKSDNQDHYRDVTVTQNVGLAKIMGWSDDFDYDVDSDGNIYAYYKYTLKDGAVSTPPVFKSVVTNQYIQHFLDGETTVNKDAMNLIITGYVVSHINDTEIPYESDNVTVKKNAAGEIDYQPWTSTKAAMLVAFPKEFEAVSSVATTQFSDGTKLLDFSATNSDWPWGHEVASYLQ